MAKRRKILDIGKDVVAVSIIASNVYGGTAKLPGYSLSQVSNGINDAYDVVAAEKTRREIEDELRKATASSRAPSTSKTLKNITGKIK